MDTEKKNIPAVMIAAAGSGNGKTTITCALLEALKRRRLSPCAFKCGPDYIDPMFHKSMIGVPSHNLDGFFLEEEQLRAVYAENAGQSGIAVVEGAMGLFDGIGGIREEGSAYRVAAALGIPIVLVVDAHGMGRSLLPLIAGFLQYDREKRIRGVILNRISAGFYEPLAAAIEREIGIPVLGFLPKRQELVLESRHLGLKLPEEITGLREQIQTAADLLESNVSLERILEIAKEAEALWPYQTPDIRQLKEEGLPVTPPIRVGIARDEAFCFYYEENLKLLRQLGVELVDFSPLHDDKLPADIFGIILGGGYPELYAKELEKNVSMRRAIRCAIQGGMPSVAECGGFMYLHETLEDEKKNIYAMCGVVPGKCFYTGRSVRFGYIALSEKEAAFLKAGTDIKGHEFHYYDSENNGTDCIAEKPVTQKTWECAHKTENYFWGFPHLYYLSNPDFAVHFVHAARSLRALRAGSGIFC